MTEFENAPEKALGDLLAGYADIHPYDRADVPDAARMLFGPLDAEDSAREKLGAAIISWLETRRKEPLPSTGGRRQRRVREICEAIEIVGLLRLPNAAVQLRRRFVTWNDWLVRLVLSPARDARAEYWRTLALTQPLVAETEPEIDAYGLAPFWRNICGESGGRLPKQYLGIGLLGLRRVPATEEGSELPWIWGLAHWALERNPSEDDFMAEWMALKALYPRSARRWRSLVGALLSTSAFKDKGVTPPHWWGDDSDFEPMKRDEFKPSGRHLFSPMPKEGKQIIAQFEKPFADVEPRIDSLLKRHRHFLNATGDSQFFAVTIHSLGSKLIARGGDNPNARAQKAQLMAREGLNVAPNDRHLWTLWRDAFAAMADFEAAELVGWEAIRNDPMDIDKRTQLATLLTRFPERRNEAEAILKETIEKFPDNAHARNQLAELFLAEDSVAEATTVVDAAFVAQAHNEATYALRARICSHEGQAEDAMAAVVGGLALDPSNNPLKDYRRLLEEGKTLRLKSHAFMEEPQQPPVQAEAASVSTPLPEEVMRRGAARRLRFRLDTGTSAESGKAIDELRRILKEDQTFAYAKLLAARQRIWKDESDILSSFAISFEEALAAEDREKLEKLAEFQPRLEALTLVARAVLGDAHAAQKVEAWLRGEADPHEEPAVATLRAGLRPVFEAIKGGRAANDVFVEQRETVMRELYDANESRLGDMLIAA